MPSAIAVADAHDPRCLRTRVGRGIEHAEHRRHVTGVYQVEQRVEDDVRCRPSGHMFHFGADPLDPV
jgi:hypothetical protein